MTDFGSYVIRHRLTDIVQRPVFNPLQDSSLRARDVDFLHQDLEDGEARMSSGTIAYNIPTPSETWRPTSVGIRNTHPIHIPVR